MARINSRRRPIALLVFSTLGALVVSGCADPTPSTGDKASASAGAKAESAITTSWGNKPVDSVVALVPAQFKNKPIKNAIYNNFPPQEFLEGNTLVGIQPDIALAVSEVMGVKLQNLSVGSFDSLIPGTVSGRYDMSSADFGVTADRLKQVDFVTEFKIGTAFAVKKGSSIKIDKATDLCGHSVGVQSGSYFIDQIKGANKDCAKAGLKSIDLKTYPDDGARILAITNGRIEITATTEDALGYTIKSQNVPLELQKFVYAPLEQAIVIPNDSKLGPAVEAGMKEIVENGTYAKILKKWGADSLAYDSADDVQYLTDPSQTPKS
ncbi:ABC transporter substrate-binding protein [Streptomyces fulvoviolaceus]|uniref:ABC transporter substrate-binding protein n=1 Tax=Streptomyces fulvoviolaceus TaxID=285535 RepID=UPI0004CC1226|nr:ABC transporter substrate-binding protein [Streptomyces fulvoviolaceus]